MHKHLNKIRQKINRKYINNTVSEERRPNVDDEEFTPTLDETYKETNLVNSLPKLFCESEASIEVFVRKFFKTAHLHDLLILDNNAKFLNGGGQYTMSIGSTFGDIHVWVVSLYKDDQNQFCAECKVYAKTSQLSTIFSSKNGSHYKPYFNSTENTIVLKGSKNTFYITEPDPKVRKFIMRSDLATSEQQEPDFLRDLVTLVSNSTGIAFLKKDKLFGLLLKYVNEEWLIFNATLIKVD